jgi:hypothetical protein
MNARRWKQRVLDGYMAESGANYFVPAEFLAWLRERPDHECYPTFFSISDEQAAQAYREDMVRKWVSGLRVVVRREDVVQHYVGRIEVREYTLPLVHSPEGGRRMGGGYLHTDASDAEHVRELAAQAGTALGAWLARYTGALNIIGIDVGAIEAIRSDIAAAVARDEAA